MDQELLKLLESSGFTEKEAGVYLALLELGSADVTDIARISGLKRAIIYVILEGLIKRGYASQLPERKINTYQAADPSVILTQLKTTTKNFSEMLPFMQTLANKGERKPKITYINNKEGIWKIFQEFNFKETAYFVSEYSVIEQFFPGSVEKWISDYKKGLYSVRGRHIVPDNERELIIGKKFKEAGQDVKIFSGVKGLKMDFTLCENKLAITSFEENPFLVLIESEALVKSMAPFFELAWEKGREIK